MPRTHAFALLIALWLSTPAFARTCGDVDVSGLAPEVAETVSAALEAFEGAERVDPATYGELGMLLHAQSLHAEADDCYRAAGYANPGEFRWAYLRGVVLEEQGQLDAAGQAYLSALRARPDYSAGATRLAAILRRQGDIDAAGLVLRRFDSPDASPALHAALGEQRLAEENFEAAIDHLQTAVEAVPKADRLHYLLAQAYRGRGEEEKARSHLERSGTVGLTPEDPALAEVRQMAAGSLAFVLKGRRAFNAGDMEGAAQAFREALERNPDSTEARVNLATALFNLGEVSRASSHFEKVLEQSPENRAALFNLAAIHEQTDPDKAKAYYRRLLEIDPNDMEAHLRLGQLFANTEQIPAALEHLNTARGDLRFFVPASTALVQILEASRREAEAIELLEESRAIAPRDPTLAANAIRLLASARDRDARDGQAALELAQQFHQAMENSQSARLVALAYAELRRCADARAWLSQAIDLTTDRDEKQMLRAFRDNLSDDCRPR